MATYGMSRFTWSDMGQNHSTKWGYSRGYNSAWQGVMDTIEAESISVAFQIGVEVVESIDITTTAVAGLGNLVYATPPCKPEYFVALDSILNIEIVTIDSFGTLGPGDSILGKGNWDEQALKRVIEDYSMSAKPWLNIDVALHKEESDCVFGLRMLVETTMDTIEIETGMTYWK